MNYWPEYLLTIQIQTAMLGICTVALILIAAASIKRTRLLEKKQKTEPVYSVDTATGRFLDELALWQGVSRGFLETDKSLRNRMRKNIENLK